jgi:tetratricopeptide (TPR) repeat protein
MDYSPKRRIAIRLTATHLTLAALALAAAGCPPQAAHTSGGQAQRLESAEDLYRQGRAIEDRVAGSNTEAQANLQQARTVYIRALQAKPSEKLEAYIRAGLGNVAFYQDDYQTALQQWASAYDRLDDPNLKSMTLLRLGMAQQRLGRFDQADRTFLTLQQQHPQSSAAQLSRTKYGARQFYVQLAVFSQANLADKAVLQLRKDGFAPSRLTDVQGRQVIRVGPAHTYAEALAMKNRLTETYPTAIIAP